MTKELDERKRLIDVYGSMSDDELLVLAGELTELSAVAQEVLTAECSRRKLEVLTSSQEGSASLEEQEYELLVTVREFRDLPEADLAKSMLQSAGITSYLQDENMIRMNWFNSNFFGGVKLRVLQENAEAAAEILDQAIPSNFEVEGVGAFVQPRCPGCNSLEVTFTGLNKPVAYSLMWVGLPIPVPSNRWKCDACGKQWTEESDSMTKESGANDG